MLHVHRQLFGLDIEFCLQRAVQDLSERSRARLKQVLQECALESLALLIVSLITVATLVWVVTTVADTHTGTAASLYQDIPAAIPATSAIDPITLTQWADESDNELWATQRDTEIGY